MTKRDAPNTKLIIELNLSAAERAGLEKLVSAFRGPSAKPDMRGSGRAFERDGEDTVAADLPGYRAPSDEG